MTLNDPGPLLSTLAQSAAVFVAIVGGFLVSRLVSLSSERDGLRRRYNEARDQLKHVEAAYRDAHEYRLRNSQTDFRRWVLDDLIGVPPDEVDREALLTSKIPRGSSTREMAPYLEHLIERVAEVTEEIAARLDPNDTTLVTLADLEARGLVVAEDERQIYGKVVDSLAAELPTPASKFGLMGGVRMPTIVSPITLSAELRRLDESIQDEQELHGRLRILRAEVTRLRAEMDLAGRPVGVSPAIVILGVYSGVGIVAPVLVLALHPKVLVRWQLWTLVAVFIAGLFAVLAYVLWYARTLSRPTVGDDNEPTGS